MQRFHLPLTPRTSLLFPALLSAGALLSAQTDAAVQGLRFADLDADGSLDRVLLQAEGGVRIELHRGGRHFEAVAQDLPAVRVQDVLVSDLDRDGRADLYLICAGANQVLLGDGTGLFRPSTAHAVLQDEGQGRSAERRDCDGDGIADLVLRNAGADRLFWANADGSFDADRSVEVAASGGTGTVVLPETATASGSAATGSSANAPTQGAPGGRRPVSTGSGAPVSVASGSGAPVALAPPTSGAVSALGGIAVQADSLTDQGAPGESLQASSVPTLGSLYPMSGDFYVDAATGFVSVNRLNAPEVPLHIAAGVDLTLSGGGGFMLGSPTARNLVFDNNEIQARDNGAFSELKFQNEGGAVTFGEKGTGRVMIGTGSTASGGQVVIEGDGLEHQLRLNQVDEALGAIQIRNRADGTNARADIRVLDNGMLSVSQDFTTAVPAILDPSGAWIAGSDERLKTDVEPLTDVLGRARAIEPVSYDLLGADGQPQPARQIGFLAQDVQAQFPELVRDTGDFLYLNYASLSVVAIAGLQEHVERSQAALEALRATNERLERRIEELEAGR